MKQTVSQLMTSVSQTFPRGSIANWQSFFNTNLEAWLYELCDYPFWFLTQQPSPAFWQNYANGAVDYTTIPLVYGQWAATGWLILPTGITQYSMATPFEEDFEGQITWWSIYRAAGIESAQLHDETGRPIQDLELIPPNEFTNKFYYATGGSTPGQPKYMTLRTTEAGSSLSIWPRPDKYYALSVIWTLRESPPYTSPADSNQYAKFLSWAPNAVLYKCLIETAMFFDEAEMQAKFEKKLYGVPGAPKRDMDSMTNIGGIIGSLKEETERKGRQRHQQAKFWPSMARATGRHSPYSGKGALPWGYGYIF